MPSYYQPEMMVADGRVCKGAGLLVDDRGFVTAVCNRAGLAAGTEVVSLAGKALFPGLANVHSHTFQRLFRGLAEGRAVGGDTFWTWREQMYRAAAFVSPEDLYAIARVTFLEMVRAGVTVAGEFHYLHRDPHGDAYADPNELGRQVIAAAQSVGLRLCLLRSAYFRAGYELASHAGQRRFYELPGEYLRNLEVLTAACEGIDQVTVGAAPHSIRAVPIERMKEIAAYVRSNGERPLHLHISEQVGENEACIREYGTTPVELMERSGILSRRTTLIHAIHLTDDEYAMVARSGATIGSCPTTERNLGDGIFPADTAARLGIPVAFGTDSQAQIDLLEDARQLEYHLRLEQQQRGILDAPARSGWVSREAIGPALFRAASSNGYAALGLTGGRLAPGQPADFFTADLDDLSILGMGLDTGLEYETVLAQAVFAMAKPAICDVAVQGRLILKDGCHVHEDEICDRYTDVHRRYLATV